MSCSAGDGPAIRAHGLGKCYHIYERPQDRLKQFLARGRRRYYREFWANRGIDLEIPRGQTCGIVGRNGAGKTTLLQMIAGILEPTEGQVEVDGRVTSLLELGSGFNGDFSGRENVFLNGAVLGIPRHEMEARFPAIEAFAEIGDFLDQPVKTYSSGMFVRLAFAVLANLDPDVFIVDEALAVGDAYFRHRCMRRFHELREAGTTILYVSHDAVSMKRLCEQVLWLDRGELREAGPPAVVVENYLGSLFGIEEVEQAIAEGIVPPQPGESEPEAAASPGQGEPAPPDEGACAALGIPNLCSPRCDRRLGDQRLTIEGLALVDSSGHLVSACEHGSELSLWLEVLDRDRPEGSEWVPGYILRNHLGEDIASTNALIEGVRMPPLGRAARRHVELRFELPLLAPGSYSLSPTLAYAASDTPLQLSDQLDNALVFDVAATREVYCVLGMRTEFHSPEPRRLTPGEA